MDAKVTCAVICGGDPPTPAFLRNVLTDTDYIICADGGLTPALAAGITPDLLVGDFDSYRGVLPAVETVRLPAAKDYTDSHEALFAGLERGFCRFRLLGALGGRLDHTLANLALLSFLEQRGAAGEICSETHRIRLLKNGSLTLPAWGKYFSILPVNGPARGVTLTGTRWRLEQATLDPAMPISVSNEQLEDAVTLSVADGALLVMQMKE